MRVYGFASLLCALGARSAVFAAHPLITDDTGTQGRGNFQLEVNAEYESDKEAGATTRTTQGAAALSYGISEPLDILLGLPYQSLRTEAPEATTEEEGAADLGLEVKWRFWERAGQSLALKPGLVLPIGDHEKGLGAGKVTYHLFLIATGELAAWTAHANLGYLRNENKNGESTNLWHLSLAPVLELAQGLSAVANLGAETNADPGDDTLPAFVLAGLVYSPLKNLDLDLGFKAGFTRAEADYSLLAGTTWRF